VEVRTPGAGLLVGFRELSEGFVSMLPSPAAGRRRRVRDAHPPTAVRTASLAEPSPDTVVVSGLTETNAIASIKAR
jgi:hypothetical protein